MFVKVGPIEVTETVFVAGKVRGHPVQNDSDTVLVERINEKHEILRFSVTAGGGKETEGFVAPGPVEWMFHHRKKLHVSKTHALHIFG